MKNITHHAHKIAFGFLLLFCLSVNVVIAQKPHPVDALEIRLEEDEKQFNLREGTKKLDAITGFTRSHYAINQAMKEGTPESMAAEYLKENKGDYGLLHADLRDLKVHAVRITDAGKIVRYRQHHHGIPVNKAEITVTISHNNIIRMVQSSYVSPLKLDNPSASITEKEAIEIANEYINPVRLMHEDRYRLMIYSNNVSTRLAHEVTIFAGEPQGEWSVYIDAETGEIFKVQNMLAYHCGKDHDHKHDCKDHEADPPKTKNYNSIVAVVDGSGLTFDPDPLSSNTVAYGGNYSDNNDATNVDLDNSRFNVVLRDIEELGGVYKLLGPWAEIRDHDAPTTGLFTQNSSVFDFDREEQGFEAVTCYFHIDSMMRYINNTLGCVAVPYQYTTGVRFDPHGASGADNSFYNSSGQLTFGEGCVDDGEDSDVIHHELGHFLHDMVTVGGLSQKEGLSEGIGDYVAQSYNRSLGNWTSSDPAYHWVFNWDGHNECWPGRVTNNPDGYPAGLGGGLHSDGTIWSTCMMDVWDILGRDATDKIFWEGLGMTNGNSDQTDSANAVYQAAIDLGYSSGDIAAIHAAFTSCGYTMPPLDGPPVADFTESATTICRDVINTIDFTDVSTSSPPATNWLWTFQGGTPATSTSQNPTTTYTSDGVFDVSLQVTNVNGTDVITKSGHITVVSGSNCPTCDNGVNNTVVTISENGAGNVYTSVINNPSGGLITDVNVTNITGEHTYLGDLIFSLISPLGTVVQLNQATCGTDEDFDVGFDDDATTSTLPCPYTDAMLYIPFESLSAFNGEDAAGDWTLSIEDQFNLDGGELQSWAIEICKEPPAPDCDDVDLTVAAPVTDQYYASNSVISAGTVPTTNDVLFQVDGQGDGIYLDPGFEVELNAIFTAQIGPCP